MIKVMTPVRASRSAFRFWTSAKSLPVLLFAVTLIAAVPVLSRVDFDRFQDTLALAGWPALMIVIAAATGNTALRIVRFAYYMRRLHAHVPLQGLALLYVAGYSMSATPAKIGELLRVTLLQVRHGVPYRRGLAAMVADRATDVLAVTALCIASLAAYPAYWLPAAAMGAVFAGGSILLAHPRRLCRLVAVVYAVTGRHHRFLFRLRRLIRQTAVLFGSEPLAIGVGLGAAGWLLECLALWACAQMLSPGVSVPQAVFVFSFATLAGGLTFLPGGVGGTELTMVSLLTLAGLSASQAIVVTAIVRLGTLWFGLACGYGALGILATDRGNSVQQSSSELSAQEELRPVGFAGTAGTVPGTAGTS